MLLPFVIVELARFRQASCEGSGQVLRVRSSAMDPDAVSRPHRVSGDERLGSNPRPAQTQRTVVAGQPDRWVVWMSGVHEDRRAGGGGVPGPEAGQVGPGEARHVQVILGPPGWDRDLRVGPWSEPERETAVALPLRTPEGDWFLNRCPGKLQVDRSTVVVGSIDAQQKLLAHDLPAGC